MEMFLQACRWSGSLRLNVDHLSESITTGRVLRQPFALVGSDPRMDLFLNHPDISRRHAYLQLLGGKLFCIDLHSRTGIHWQGATKHSGWLDTDQALGIGPFLIRAAGGSEALPLELPLCALQSPGNEALPHVALEFVNRLPGPTVWRMGTILALVGRAPLCRVRLMGDSISRFHCSLVRTPLGLWVVDLFGKGGITVNEAPVRSARLEDGDHLQVGNFVIRIRCPQPAPLRIPFSHLTDGSELAMKPLGSNVALPTPQETPIAEPATIAPQEPPSVAALGTQLPNGPPLSLVPQLASVPAESTPRNTEVVQTLLLPIAQQLGMVQHQMFEQFQQAMVMMFQMFGKLQRDQIGIIRDEMDRLHQLSREVMALQTELAKQTQSAAEKPRSQAAMARPRAAAYSAAANPASRPAPAMKNNLESKPLPPSQGRPEKDMHAWLSERIAALQQERQTRWQKIVSFLGGLGTTPAPDGKP
jgi:pSer/pThr/pTyr-binding forkhead associated (FHA) protein